MWWESLVIARPGRKQEAAGEELGTASGGRARTPRNREVTHQASRGAPKTSSLALRWKKGRAVVHWESCQFAPL